MRPIRLYIEVLPWQKSRLTNGCTQNTRPEVILPWIEPCAEDVSLQELSERIVSRFASIHRGKGVLNIECLQNYWGYILDMPLTVGEVFDDLPANTTDISRSIVKVVRSPPTPEELENPLRFVSLVAESSARPRKRPLTQLAAAVWDNQYLGENAQGWGSDGLIDGNGRASKRRKLQNSTSHTGFGSDRQMFRCEGLQDGVYVSSRTSAGRLSPNRRIADSPRSSPRKQDNSYATPTSLSLNSPPRVDSSNLIDPIAIPDSPRRREASFADGNIPHSTNFELHAPRPESPELGSTNNRAPLGCSVTESVERAEPKTQALQGYIESPLLIPGPLKNGTDRLGDQPIVFGKQDAREDNSAPSMPSNSSSAEKILSRNRSGATALREPNGTILGSRDTIDPMERESENSHELPKSSSDEHAKPEAFAPTLHDLEDGEHSKNNLKAVANTSKNTSIVAENEGKEYLAHHTQIKTPAPRTSRSDRRAAGEAPKRTGDEAPVSRLADGAEGVRLAERQGARAINHVEPAAIAKQADEITVKTFLWDEGANAAKLAEEASIVRPTERKVIGATLAEGKVAEAKEVEGNPPKGSVATRRTKAARLAEGKKPVKVAKESQARDKVQKKDVKPSLECEEKSLRESNESVPLSQMKTQKPENPPAASSSALTLNPEHSSQHTTKSENLENNRVLSVIIDERTHSSAVPETPKTRNPSDDRSQNSNTPLTPRIEPDRIRKSMTPPYPSPLTRKPRQKSSVPSHSLLLRKSLNSDTLPRSAIKQNTSSGRHAVSFAEDSTAILDARRGTAPSDNKESERGISSVMKVVKGEHATEALAGSQAPKKITEKSRAASTKSAKKEKTQSKLMVKRDVKLKGRVIDPPVPPKALAPKEIVISSDSEYSVSSFYSEEDVETRNARPGPSKRRKLTVRADSSKETTRLEVRPNPVLAKSLTKTEVTQPSTRAPKIGRPDEKLPSTAVASSSPENIDPRILSFISSSGRSSPRAPAQYMSRAVSISSNPTSDISESDSDENSTSSPEETKGLPARETRLDRTVSDTSAGVQILHADSVSLNGGQASRSSKALSVSSRSSGPSSGSKSRRTEHSAEEQLQRESRQSMEPSQVVRPASLNTRSVAHKKPARTSVSDIPPTSFDFPRMTDLMKSQSTVATSGSGTQLSSYPSSSKPDPRKRATLSPFIVSGSSSSGSSSDDEEDT